MFDVNDITIGYTLDFLSSLYEHQTPIRIGLVPVAKEEDMPAVTLAQAFYKLVDEVEGPEAVRKLAKVIHLLSL